MRRSHNQRMIDRRGLFRIVGSAVLVVGLGLAISGLLWGCSNGAEVTKVTQDTIGSGISALPELPSLDRAAPGSFQTASFAFG